MIRHPRIGLTIITGLLLGASFAARARGDERVIYEGKSEINSTIIVTEDEKGLRTLRFEEGGARQTVVKPGDPDHLELPYARGMLAGLAFAHRVDRVLIVGLGGGSIPMILRKHYPDMTIDVVDIDPEVVRLAKQYFGFREDDKLKAHVADGRRFIEECKEPYDVIYLDAFSADSIPTHLTTREFLQATGRALTRGGIVVSNVWSSGANRLYDRMVRTYLEVFPELYILDISRAGNKILIAVPLARKFTRDDLVQRSAAVSREATFPFDLSEVVSKGLETAPKKAKVKPLTDPPPASIEVPKNPPVPSSSRVTP
jgi:spermidine synthase